MKKTVLMSAAKKARIALAVMAVFGMSFVGAQEAFATNTIYGTAIDAPSSMPNNNVIFGHDIKLGDYAYNTVVVGSDNEIGNLAAHAVVVGKNIKAESYWGVAIGLYSELGNMASITLGAHSTATGEDSDAFGKASKATGKYSVALGDDSTAGEDYTVSVGGMHEVQVGNEPSGAPIIEEQWLRRRITNVADGAADSDAATVGQVKSMIAAGGAGSITTEKFNEMLNNNDAFNSLKNNMNGKADVDGGNIDKSQWANKLGTGAIANGDKNLVNGETVYNKIGDLNSLTTTEQGNLVGAVNEVNKKANDAQTTANSALNKANTNATNIGNLGELNTTNKGNLVGAVNEVNTKADKNAEDIKNVNGRVDELGGRVDTLGGAVAKLDSRVNKVGAGAAALAALHPMEFDSDNKLSFAAGVGNYRGTNAAAIGAFYRPSEQVMFSIAGNMGNGENMVNAGVSFALDRPSKTPTTKAALVKTVVAQNEQIAALNETLAEQSREIAELKAMVQQLAAKQNA